MARSVSTILAQMDAEQAAQSSLSGLNSTSQTAIYRLWKYITAVMINFLEQLNDIFKTEIEGTIASASVGSNAWFQSKILEFQYDATTPQVLTIVNFAPQYATIDETKRIITRCAVKTSATKTVFVKVAKSDPPVALSAPELSSLDGYVSDLAFAGVNYLVSSTDADQIYIKGEIYYDGQYAAVISDNVIAAINDYLANIPFDGSVKIMSLQDAIQSVEGVTDIVLSDVAVRADATLFANKTYLVQNKTTIINNYPTEAGYVIEETTASNTFADTLTFVAQ